MPGQNLVPNAGFEAFHQCPPYPGQIHEAVNWDTPNNNTTDYFHRCAPPEDGASVPQNLLGIQEPYAGSGYTGIRTWIPVIPGNPIYREYLCTRLEEPLQPGERYAVHFRVSLAETSSHASDNLGIYFSPLPFENQRLYAVQPQVENPAGHIIQNTEDWITLSGTFVAEGGEEYLIIGNFLDDETMTRKRLFEDEEPKVYFYIDEVVVEACHYPASLTVEVDTTICEGEQLKLLGLPDAQAYRWDNQVSTRERTVTQAGRYTVVSNQLCHDITTIYQVTEVDCTCNPGFLSPQFLGRGLQVHTNDFTDITQVSIFDVAGRLVAKLKKHQLQNQAVLRLAAGTYYYQIRYRCNHSNNPTADIQTGRFIAVR